MAFNNPKQRIAAILAERKKTLGPMPKNPMAPINATTQPMGMTPPSSLSPMSNPMAPATSPMMGPAKLPGQGRFGKIKKMF